MVSHRAGRFKLPFLLFTCHSLPAAAGVACQPVIDDAVLAVA